MNCHRICNIKQVDVVFNTTSQQADITHIDLRIASNDDNDLLMGDYLKDYTNRSPEESSFCVSVAGKNGDKLVRKSSLIWSISNSRDKLSTDRLKRVQAKKKTARSLEFVDVSSSVDFIFRNTEIKIGDWFFFIIRFTNTTMISKVSSWEI